MRGACLGWCVWSLVLVIRVSGYECVAGMGVSMSVGCVWASFNAWVWWCVWGGEMCLVASGFNSVRSACWLGGVRVWVRLEGMRAYLGDASVLGLLVADLLFHYESHCSLRTHVSCGRIK